MRQYKLVSRNGVEVGAFYEENGTRTSFGFADPANSDYKAYERWKAEGNTPEPADVPAVVPPRVVSMRQARLALLQANLLNSVTSAVNASDAATQIEWEYAAEVNRDSPLVVSLTQTLGMTEAQLDQLFGLATTL